MAKRLTSFDRVNRGDRIRVTVRSSLDGELSAELYTVARTSTQPGFQRVFLVRSGVTPLAGRSGAFEEDWPREAGYHFYDTSMLPDHEEPIGKRGGYELLEPELTWVGDATTGDAEARVKDGRYIVRRSYHEGQLKGYLVLYGLGMSESELIMHKTIPAAKDFALQDAITQGRV